MSKFQIFPGTSRYAASPTAPQRSPLPVAWYLVARKCAMFQKTEAISTTLALSTLVPPSPAPCKPSPHSRSLAYHFCSSTPPSATRSTNNMPNPTKHRCADLSTAPLPQWRIGAIYFCKQYRAGILHFCNSAPCQRTCFPPRIPRLTSNPKGHDLLAIRKSGRFKAQHFRIWLRQLPTPTPHYRYRTYP